MYHQTDRIGWTDRTTKRTDWDGPRKSRVSTLRPMFRNDNRVYLDTKQVYLSVVVFESASPIVWGHLVEHMNNLVLDWP